MSAGPGDVVGRGIGPRGVGPGLLLPGYLQWRRGQTERALVLVVGFSSALGVGIFAWGTPLGLAMWAGAYALHAASIADAMRQAAFPAFARGVPATSAALALGVGGYAPLLAFAWSFAWIGPEFPPWGERHLIDRRAYRAAAPDPGDWIGYRAGTSPGVAVARVVAGPGREVEWRERRLRVEGRPLGWHPRGLPPAELALRVPDGHLLVSSEHDSSGLALVPTDRVIGRAWARYYPIRSRRLLP